MILAVFSNLNDPMILYLLACRTPKRITSNFFDTAFQFAKITLNSHPVFQCFHSLPKMVLEDT